MYGGPKYLLNNNITNVVPVIHAIHRKTDTNNSKQQPILSILKYLISKKRASPNLAGLSVRLP
jgi:hypothetical protein